MRADRIFINARLATMARGLGVVERGMVAELGGRIVYAGAPQRIDAEVVVDCGGRWVTPGLIDCHTHLVYGGDRAPEFEQRLNGASYEEIAAAGGGIISTVKATRAARDAVLAAQALPRVATLVAEGGDHRRDQIRLWADRGERIAALAGNPEVRAGVAGGCGGDIFGGACAAARICR